LTVSGAGSGIADMAAAIAIWNLVWRRHTNLLKLGSWFSIVASRYQI